MNKQRLKVYKEGEHYIGVIPESSGPRKSHEDKFSKEIKDNFKRYYKEAIAEGISPKKTKKIVEYICDRSWENDISAWILPEEAVELLDRHAKSVHDRRKRYRRKVDFNNWNYFVTFTYDDEKQTESSFIKKLRKTLSNLSTRNSWRYIGVRERGEKSGRVHYHFIMYIPKGEMVGELFLDHRYSSKRRQMEYFTNNTYFQDTFGQSCWEAICLEDKNDGKVENYLLKYLEKSDEKLIYSRHVHDHAVIEVDLDEDVLFFFRQYCVKCILKDKLFGGSKEDLAELDSFQVDFINLSTFLEYDYFLTLR